MLFNCSCNALLQQIHAFLAALIRTCHSISETSAASWFTLDHNRPFDQFQDNATSKFAETISLRTPMLKLCAKLLLTWRSVLWSSLMEKMAWIMVVYPGILCFNYFCSISQMLEVTGVTNSFTFVESSSSCCLMKCSTHSIGESSWCHCHIFYMFLTRID